MSTETGKPTASAAEPLRVLWARNHTTIMKGMGVFLAGPTPLSSEEMSVGWRRVVVEALLKDERLCPHMTVVCPEPESTDWSSIVVNTGKRSHDHAVNQQVSWELQYLDACAITAFWMPTYWERESSGPFPANIGATTRLEFGYYLSRWEHDPHKYELVLGGPEDADKLAWVRLKAKSNKLRWHSLKKRDKDKMVSADFIESIAQSLLKRKWCGCP